MATGRGHGEYMLLSMRAPNELNCGMRKPRPLARVFDMFFRIARVDPDVIERLLGSHGA